jgi:hypothetical protein
MKSKTSNIPSSTGRPSVTLGIEFIMQNGGLECVSVRDHNAMDSTFLPHFTTHYNLQTNVMKIGRKLLGGSVVWKGHTTKMLVDFILSFNSEIAVWREATPFPCKQNQFCSICKS